MALPRRALCALGILRFAQDDKPKSWWAEGPDHEQSRSDGYCVAKVLRRLLICLTSIAKESWPDTESSHHDSTG